MSKLLLTMCFVAFGVAGCQTSGTTYNKQSVTTKPSLSNYSSDLAYAIDLAIYAFPRRCVWYKTEDSSRVGAVKRPDNFTFNQIISDKNVDGWYAAMVNPTDAAHLGTGSIPFYLNTKYASSACSEKGLANVAPGFNFENGRFFDVNKTINTKSPSGKTPTAVSTNKTGPLAHMKDTDGCRLAGVYRPGTPPKWSVEASMHKYVSEMKRRGFSIDECAKLM